jgi:hypothetical protein
MNDVLEVIEPGGTTRYVEPIPHGIFKQMQDLVGGYIKPIYLPGGRVMMVDEDGHLKGLTFNGVATDVVEKAGQAHLNPRVVGVAVVCDRKYVS